MNVQPTMSNVFNTSGGGDNSSVVSRGLRSRDKSSDQKRLTFFPDFQEMGETGPLYNEFVGTSKHSIKKRFSLEIT